MSEILIYDIVCSMIKVMPKEKPFSLKAHFPQRNQFFWFNIKLTLGFVLFFLFLQ